MSVGFWIAFLIFIAIMLLVDIRVFNRHPHEIELREALIWSAIWIGISVLFGIWLYFSQGAETGTAFFAGYLLEKSLSVDNIFVFVLIFTYFKVPAKLQRRVLTWGIVGAVVLRAIFIFAGVALLERFEWMIYIFGAFLVYTALKLAQGGESEMDPGSNPMVALVRRFFPVTDDYEGESFFVRHGGKLMATPLFIVLVVIESSDVVFAVDSIPAILGITQDQFVVFSSNILAILGLRALYFALAGIMNMFHYLQYGLAAILGFVGVKMLLSHWWHPSTAVALGVIVGVLTISIIASIMWPQPEHKTAVID